MNLNTSNGKKECNIEHLKNTSNSSLTLDELILLNKVLEEYNDLFPEIMALKKENFLSLFQKYIQIYFASKNIIFSNDILHKIMEIVLNDYYLIEKEKIDNCIKSLDKVQIFNDNIYKNYIPHCYKANNPVHTCGEKFYELDKGKYYYCLKCNKTYEQKSVLLFCQNCKKEYYSEIKENYNIINKNKIDYKLKPATWVKYHCNISMNDTMKCPKCNNCFYINMKNKLFCIKCNYEIEQFDIIWKCQICNKEFTSEAKEYNPLEFKIFKLAVKRCIFIGIEAKPPFIPCCKVSANELKNLKFIHKKKCNGILYEGVLDNKKIVVCLKCNMINRYENHFWMCPLCKNKFSTNNNYENNLKGNIIYENNKYYQTEKFSKKYKKYINNENVYKNSKNIFHNYNRFINKEEPKNDKININGENIGKNFKKYKSEINNNLFSSNNFYNKTDENNNSKYKLENNNIEKVNDMYLYNYLNNKSSKKISKNINYISGNNNKLDFETNNYINDTEDNNIKPYKNINKINNFETDVFMNNSSKFLKLISHDNLSHQKLYENYKNKKANNNISNFHNNNNNLSNININLNVNVNINNNQKEKLLKSLSSYKEIRKKNLSDYNSNFKSYRKQLKNLSIDLSNNVPIRTLSNFDIDDYNIVKSIGEGTFGKIYEVEDKYQRHFAMKKLICSSIKEIEILKKEYEFLFNFEDLNTNLIKIYGIETKKLDRTTFVMYVLMELAKTDWEKEIIKRKKINNYYSEKELILILRDLTITLSKLQQNNISHRDIKPQNILLCENGILKISDFGEAKENFNNRNNLNETEKQTIRGTELYMSPALFKSLKRKIKSKYAKHNTYKSDVFSLGYCILLAASLNFDCLYSIREIHDMNIIKKKINSFINKRYSDKFIHIILTMLETEEKNRPDFVQLEKIIEEL